MHKIKRNLSIGNRWSCFVILTAICGVLYGSNLDSFFLGDDYTNLGRFQSLSDEPYSQIALLAFTDAYGGFYRPLQFIAYFSPLLLFGITPIPHHLIALVLHILNGLIVVLCTRSLLHNTDWIERRWSNIIGLWAAIIFVVHPRHVESVGYVYTLENPLCGMFYLSGFLCFLRFVNSGHRSYLIAYGVCWFSSLLTKEMGVTLPILCFFYLVSVWSELTDLGRTRIGSNFQLLVARVRSRGFVDFFVITLVVTTIYTVMRFSLLGVIGGGQEGQLDFSAVRMARTLFQSIIAMIVPNAMPGMAWAEDFFRAHILLFIGFGSFVLLLGLWSIRRLGDSLVWFSCVWCFISLLPVLNLGIGVREITGNRFLYIPLFGFVLACAVIVGKMRKSKARSTIMVIIPLALSIATLRNVMDMNFASRIAEKALVDYMMATKSDDSESSVLLVLPAMYKGIYVYYLNSSFPAALSVFHGVEGEHMGKKIEFVLRTFLNDSTGATSVSYARDEAIIQLRAHGEGGFMWKDSFYDLDQLETVQLKLEDRVALNSMGDFIARRASVNDQFGKVVIAGVASSKMVIR